MDKLKSRIIDILKYLKMDLCERDEIVSVALLSALIDQNIFLYGPPGTAKSLISRRISKVFKVDNYFEYLMQKFSTPEEVFGPISLTELKKDNYVRKTDGYLPNSDFAFLDEIWKSSPAILNTLLTIINEKTYKNGNTVTKVPLKVLISASNETPPEGQGLEALYDRFLTRLYVPPTSGKNNFELLLESGGANSEINIPKKLLIENEEWKKWKIEIKKVELSKETLNIIDAIRLEFSKKNKKKSLNVYVSDRRWLKATMLIKSGAYFCDRNKTNIVDTLLLRHCLWTTKKNRLEVVEIVEKCIEESGFETGISLKGLDNKKDELEKEISKEIYYSNDIYETVSFADNNQYFKAKVALKADYYNSRSYEETFYIPYDEMKSNAEFSPVDKSGNELEYIKCEFKKQGSCSIQYNRYGKNDPNYLKGARHWNNFTDFQPNISFHKGDKRDDVNIRLVESLHKGALDLTKEIEQLETFIENKRSNFLKELDTPFVPKEKVNLALKSVNTQLEDIKLRHKDCERLINMVQFDDSEKKEIEDSSANE